MKVNGAKKLKALQADNEKKLNKIRCAIEQQQKDIEQTLFALTKWIIGLGISVAGLIVVLFGLPLIT